MRRHVMQAERLGTADELAEHPVPARQRTDPPPLLLVYPHEEKAGELLLALVQDADGGVVGAGELARRAQHGVEHRLQVELCHQGPANVEESAQLRFAEPGPCGWGHVTAPVRHLVSSVPLADRVHRRARPRVCGFSASGSRLAPDGVGPDPPYGRSTIHARRIQVSVRVAINGFGRVGRALLRSAHQSGAGIEIVAINDVTEPVTLAALLRHDSVYGRFPGVIGSTDTAITIDGTVIPVLSERDPGQLPWEDLGVDVAIESTGRFRTREAAGRHLEAGAGG